jgi:hypothetical protein
MTGTGLEVEVCMVGLESSSDQNPVSHPVHQQTGSLLFPYFVKPYILF